jgi:uncharacterized protein YegL
MTSLAKETIQSFNEFLKEQKEFPGECVFTLCTFNTDYRLVHDFVKIASVNDLDNRTYVTTGWTALLDAVGTTIDSVGRKLAAMPEEERPSKVIFLIITDGHENSSKRFAPEQIRSMVEHQKDTYSWEFVFMGANIDAIAAGTNLGISIQNTLNYQPTAAGTKALYRSVSENMSSYRASNSSRADFFNQSQQAQSQGTLVGGLTGTPPVTTTTTTTTTSTQSGSKQGK